MTNAMTQAKTSLRLKTPGSRVSRSRARRAERRSIVPIIFSALSYAVPVRQARDSGQAARSIQNPRPRSTPDNVLGRNTRPDGPAARSSRSRQVAVRRGTDPLARRLRVAAGLESTLLDQRLAAPRTQYPPAPPAAPTLSAAPRVAQFAVLEP
jgi:hypothetical protein